MPKSFGVEALDEIQTFRQITNIEAAVCAAAPNPLALHPRWKHRTSQLVQCNVARLVNIGDRVQCLRSGKHGSIVGEVDDNTELLVEWDLGGTSSACAGKNETRWDLAAL